jgi:hypothetical protein
MGDFGSVILPGNGEDRVPLASERRVRETKHAQVLLSVMPALVAGIHVLFECGEEDVDGRNRSGHDELMGCDIVRDFPIHNVKQRSAFSRPAIAGKGGPSVACAASGGWWEGRGPQRNSFN